MEAGLGWGRKYRTRWTRDYAEWEVETTLSQVLPLGGAYRFLDSRFSFVVWRINLFFFSFILIPDLFHAIKLGGKCSAERHLPLKNCFKRPTCVLELIYSYPRSFSLHKTWCSLQRSVICDIFVQKKAPPEGEAIGDTRGRNSLSCSIYNIEKIIEF